MKGILVSTSDHEGLCVPEAYNLLNEVSDIQKHYQVSLVVLTVSGNSINLVIDL